MTRPSSDSAGQSWRHLLSTWMAVSALLLVAGCGSGSDEPGSTQAGATEAGVTTGVFVDDPVQGLHYAGGASSGNGASTTAPAASMRG